MLLFATTAPPFASGHATSSRASGVLTTRFLAVWARRLYPDYTRRQSYVLAARSLSTIRILFGLLVEAVLRRLRYFIQQCRHHMASPQRIANGNWNNNEPLSTNTTVIPVDIQFNPTTSGTNISLSSDGLTATNTSTNELNCVAFSTVGVNYFTSTAKLYFSITINQISLSGATFSGNLQAGITTISAGNIIFANSGRPSVWAIAVASSTSAQDGLYAATGTPAPQYTITPANNQVWWFAYDFNARLMWFSNDGRPHGMVLHTTPRRTLR